MKERETLEHTTAALLKLYETLNNGNRELSSAANTILHAYHDMQDEIDFYDEQHREDEMDEKLNEAYEKACELGDLLRDCFLPQLARDAEDLAFDIKDVIDIGADPDEGEILHE